MNLDIPQYNFSHTRPVIGYGQFEPTPPPKNAVRMVDDTIVNKKFKVWDYVLENNLLESKNELLKAKAWHLLRDKTIYAYANFRYDNQPVKLYGLQDAVLSDKSRRVLFCGSNQSIGKSFSLNVDAATEFCFDHEKNWLGILVSGSLEQSKFQMDRIKDLLRGSSITYRYEETTVSKKGKKDSMTQVTFTFYKDDKVTPMYKNRLICCPHTSSALGYPANNLWLDEFEFWENCDQGFFLNKIAIPRTFRTRGAIKIFSNPDGKEKYMYKLWNSLRNGKPLWHRYRFNYWDGPGANLEHFENDSFNMTRTEMESTLLAVFSRTEGTFFSREEIQDMRDSELAQKGDSAGYGRETAWFLDVGSVHDQSVLVGGYLEPNPLSEDIPLINIFWIHKYPVGYPIGRVIGIGIDEEDGWEDYVDENPSVKTVLDLYSVPVDDTKYQPLFGFDATGNAGMMPLLQAANIDAVDVTFTGKLKWHMYQRYQYYVQQRFLKRANERDANTVRGCDFDYQASRLVVKKTQGMTYSKIHHENEKDLDDTQDAIAALIHLIENPNLPSLAFDVFDNEGNSIVNTETGKFKNDRDSLENQYIPSWMNRRELATFIQRKERELR